MMQFKTGGSIKDVDTEKRIVTGYFTNTGSLDSDKDIFERGAFRKTIEELGPKGKNRIWHLWMHDPFQPIAKPYKITEDDKGVYFETEVPSTTIGDMALALYVNGSMTEHSVGFNTIKYEDDNEKDERIIKEVRMWEGSSVLWGANENTPATGMKAEQVNSRINNLDKILKTGNYADNVYELIQTEIEALKTAVASLEPASTTQAEVEADKGDFNISNLLNYF